MTAGLVPVAVDDRQWVRPWGGTVGRVPRWAFAAVNARSYSVRGRVEQPSVAQAHLGSRHAEQVISLCRETPALTNAVA